jgi:hypothetical protein
MLYSYRHLVSYITQTAIMPMPKSCIVCSAVESLPDLQLQYCTQCQSALYCSKTCQRKDWKKQHKKICKFLNVGHGGMQIRNDIHTSNQIEMKDAFEVTQRYLDEDGKRFFKLSQESTKDGIRAAALEMRKITKRTTEYNQIVLLFQSIRLLVHSDSEKLLWPNSPLLVLLEFVDPNVPYGDEHDFLEEDHLRETPLYNLADLSDPSDYSTHKNQLILAKQLIEHGANVNALSIPQGMTPLHNACYAGSVTNLDFVELLLEEGADPNSQDHFGMTPLRGSLPNAPGAAKFLLNWPTTDVNITTRSGDFFLATVRELIVSYFECAGSPGNPEMVQDHFMLQQWREIEKILVKRDAHDPGYTSDSHMRHPFGAPLAPF